MNDNNNNSDSSCQKINVLFLSSSVTQSATCGSESQIISITNNRSNQYTQNTTSAIVTCCPPRQWVQQPDNDSNNDANYQPHFMYYWQQQVNCTPHTLNSKPCCILLSKDLIFCFGTKRLTLLHNITRTRTLLFQKTDNKHCTKSSRKYQNN